MDFTNAFRVSLPPAQAWELLTDVERIAPCMPGAQLTGRDGEAYQGVVKVKVGPMTIQYKGVAEFEELDEEGRTAVLRARGRDSRGQGNADARITARLAADGEAATAVTVETRLTVTGKVAQFGKGMIEEISRKLLAQFVDALERQLAAERAPAAVGAAAAPAPAVAGAAPVEAPPVDTAGEDAAAAGPAPGSTPAPRAPAASAPDQGTPAPAPVPPAAEPEPLDLLGVARGAVVKRVVPLVVALAVLVVLVVWLTR
ncbi:SRPBCC family protein [Streptomyces sp. NPDC058691]|uniref:SRPBCC family protein n=1 Tax=Streptomyces sp. NPDC058691 TaxID=3346601 RepID=UPI0036474857